MKQEKILELIKQGQHFGDFLASVIDPILDEKANFMPDEDAGVVIRIGAIHACATILVNGYDKNTSNEERVENAKRLIDMYFANFTADNIQFKDKIRT